jgi:hypothetical protein
MNTAPIGNSGQPAITPMPPRSMKSTLAGIKKIENADTDAMLRNRMAFQKQQLAEDVTIVNGKLLGLTETISTEIANLCGEVNEISPQDAVEDHLKKGARVVAQLVNTQNELLLTVNHGRERLREEMEKGVQLQQMMKDYGKEFKSASSKVPHQNELNEFGNNLSNYAAGGL